MRSPTFERAMLEEVARAAGLWGVDVEKFEDAVEERLKMGEGEYADSFATRDPAELLRELQEEGEDVCGWALLAAQNIHARSLEGLDEDMAAEIQARLIAAAANGLQLWVQVREALEVLRTAKSHATWQSKVPQPPVSCAEPV